VDQPKTNPINKAKNINNALDIEALQNRKPISTTLEFCAMKTTARLESKSTSVNFEFILFVPSCMVETVVVTDDPGSVTSLCII
jgi:hypothetical protein